MKKLQEEKFDFGIIQVFEHCAYVLYKEIGLNNYASAIPVDILNDYHGVSSMPSYVPGLFK